MKRFIIIGKIVTILVLFVIKTSESQNNSSWLEFDSKLFYVQPKGGYTWKQAVAGCKKVHSNLIEPKGDYDYKKLKDTIKHNFKNYSSFWTTAQVKSSNMFHHIGLGREEYNRKKCNKFDNSSAFKFLPENCNTRLGFICEKPLLNGYSSFKTKNMVYFIQPKQEFNCDQAVKQCDERQMFLVAFKDHAKQRFLRDYLHFNYGSNIDFWFGSKNETHNNCETATKNLNAKFNSKLGFICQRAYEPKHGLTGRHIILLIFVAVFAFIAIVVLLFIKFYYLRMRECVEQLEADLDEETKVTDIK